MIMDIESGLKARFPDLTASRQVKCHRRGVGRHVHLAIVDHRKGFLTPRICKGIGPLRTQPADVFKIDAIQRTVARLAIAHPVGQDRCRIIRVINQIVGRLRHRGLRDKKAKRDRCRECPLCNSVDHGIPPWKSVKDACLKGWLLLAPPSVRLRADNLTSPSSFNFLTVGYAKMGRYMTLVV